jgi:hypothetical protein
MPFSQNGNLRIEGPENFWEGGLNSESLRNGSPGTEGEFQGSVERCLSFSVFGW